MLRSSPIERALASASERQARKEIGMQVHKDTLATRLAAVVDAVTPGHAGDSPAIETVGLTKSYGTLTAVDHLNLTIERGEIFGFLIHSMVSPTRSCSASASRFLSVLSAFISGKVWF